MDIDLAQDWVTILNQKMRGRHLNESDTAGLLAHLKEELDELETSIKEDSHKEVAEECADALVILLALCTSQGVMLNEAFFRKMEKNEKT